MRRLGGLILAALLSVSAAQTGPAPADLSYGGANVQRLAAESYARAGLDGTFKSWLDTAYTRAGLPLAGGATLDAALKARQEQLATARTPAERDALARETATWAHTLIKKMVPKFSLERGFEFASLPRTGERQCLLQSVIIAGLLQRAGLGAGLVMVWKNMSGQESNLGHVTSVLRLPSGAGDLEVDASEPEPFATHQGVLAWAAGGERFLTPVFGTGGVITAYTRADGQGSLKPAALSFLSLGYVRSQFDYYRAEWAPGGVLGTGTGKSTPAGLQQSERELRRALSEAPDNALAAGVLGTVLRKEGRTAEARAQYLRAATLYAAQGHLPAGMRTNLAWAKGRARS